MAPTDTLKTYNRKRDFKLTPEPKGSRTPKTKGSSFVIQKHAASHLHYDFRLEAEGVLKSWAVPKGPSSDPGVKRLAMQTEDHPLGYASFEGIIPAGQYGGGQVIVWDRGTYRNTTTHKGKPISLVEGLDNGHVTFWLDGEKLKGGFALTRTGRMGAKNAWLLIKMRDDEADSNQEEPVEHQTASVISGREVDMLSADNSRTWISNRPAKSPTNRPVVVKETAAPGHPPAWIEPMLATLVDKPFDRPGWIYEPKLDGERCLAYRNKKAVKLFTRNQKNLNLTYPELVEGLQKQKPSSFVLDGEVIAFADHSTISSFRVLQRRMHLKNAAEVKRSKIKIYYVVFDLLALDGQDLRKRPLHERQKLLKENFRFGTLIRQNEQVHSAGTRFFADACRKGWEGVIAKRVDSLYSAGRSSDWLKFKCVMEQEFVIGGYTKPKGTREVLGALLIGTYKDGALLFAGKVGTGFDQTSLALLAKKMGPLETKTSPFKKATLLLRDVHWLKPQLICQVVFSEWTEEGKLRHPRYLGLREDKSPAEVGREEKVSLQNASIAERPQKEIPAKKVSTKTVTARSSGSLEMDGRTLSISHLDKVLYPSSDYTKGNVIDYYAQIAPVMLPYLKSRPVTMKRYPNGVEDKFFYEKQAPSYRPDWLETYSMKDPSTKKVTEYGLVQDLSSLLWMVNLACLEFHVLLAQAPKIDSPTMVVFDLDPGPQQTILNCISMALTMRQMFQTLKLQTFVKTSGNKGLHLYIPLNTPTTYEQTSSFARAIAQLLERRFPKLIVSNMRKVLREGKIFIDWSQNSRHKTTVAAYSLRAQPTPFVSTPVEWKELEAAKNAKDASRLRFTPDQLLKRVEKIGDVFKPVLTLKQKLPVLDLSSI